MNKIVILSCTNRPDSNTLKVSRIYDGILKEMKVATSLLDFRELPDTITATETFGRRTPGYAKILQEYVSTQDKFVFVSPEYNGSFPGILKTFLDSVHPREWAGKKACLVGVSDGRAGNLRGMEHLTGVLHYLKMNVYYNKLPISQVVKVLDAENNFLPEQRKVCVAQMEGYLGF